MKNKLLSIYRADKIYLAEWIVAIVTGLFVLLCASTWDTQSLTIWSTNLWDVIADGKFRDYYAYTAQNIYHVHHSHMGSELMSVLPWSIWNLPIWIIQRFFGKPIMGSALMLAYSKLFLVGVTVVMTVFTKKITYLITHDRYKSVLAMFLTASSTFIYLTVSYSGQNDIIMMTASVIAVYYLLKNKHGMFLLWSAIAIAIKPFFILPFVAVLLLAEKSLWKIPVKALIAVSGLVLQKLLFNGAPGYKESMEFGPAKDMLKQMFAANLNTSFGGVSFLAIALVLIYLYAYTRDFKKDDYADPNSNVGKYAVYLIAVTYTAYVMFSPFSYYRVATIVPFIYIVMVQNRTMALYNGLLDIAMQFALMMKFVLRGSILFRGDFMNKSVAQRFFGYNVRYKGSDPYCGIDHYLFQRNDLIEKLQPMFSGVAVVAAVLLLVFNHPEEKIKLKISGDRHVRVLLWVRMLIIVPFILMTLFLFVKTANKIYP